MQLDDWMEAHEEQEVTRKKARKASMAEDGWTVVVRSKVRHADPSMLVSWCTGSSCGALCSWCSSHGGHGTARR